MVGIVPTRLTYLSEDRMNAIVVQSDLARPPRTVVHDGVSYRLSEFGLSDGSELLRLADVGDLDRVELASQLASRWWNHGEPPFPDPVVAGEVIKRYSSEQDLASYLLSTLSGSVVCPPAWGHGLRLANPDEMSDSVLSETEGT